MLQGLQKQIKPWSFQPSDQNKIAVPTSRMNRSADKFLKRVSILFFVRGFTFLTLSSIALRLLQLLLLISFFGNLCFVFIRMILFWRKASLIENITKVLFFIETCSVTLLALIKKKDIISLTNQLVEAGNIKTVVDAERAAIAIAFWGMFCTTIRILIPICYGSLQMHVGAQLILLKVGEEVLRNFTSNTVIVCSMGYLTFYQLLANHLIFTIKKVRCYVSFSNFVDCMYVLQMVDYTKDTMKRFDEVFSLIPFMALFSSFCSATRTVIRVSHGREEDIINDISEFVMSNMCLVIALFYIHYKQDCIARDAELLKKEIVLKSRKGKRTHSLLSSSLISGLDAMSSIKMTAWSVFDLDKKLVFGFSAQVVQFTVLFIQLTSSQDK